MLLVIRDIRLDQGMNDEDEVHQQSNNIDVVLDETFDDVHE